MSKIQNTGPMMEIHRRVLRSCRVDIVRDLDVNDILDQMIQDDVLTMAMCNDITAKPTREERVKMLLDKLETRGNAAFPLFLRALKSTYRHLEVCLENKMMELINEEDDYKNAYMPGGQMQYLLKKSVAKDSEIVYPFDEENDDNDDSYLDCYEVAETIRSKQSTVTGPQMPPPPPGHPQRSAKTKDYKEVNFTGLINNTLYFINIQHEDLPSGVRHPPHYCKVYIPCVSPAELDQKQDIVVPAHGSETEIYDCVSENEGGNAFEPEGDDDRTSLHEGCQEDDLKNDEEEPPINETEPKAPEFLDTLENEINDRRYENVQFGTQKTKSSDDITLQSDADATPKDAMDGALSTDVLTENTESNELQPEQADRDSINIDTVNETKPQCKIAVSSYSNDVRNLKKSEDVVVLKKNEMLIVEKTKVTSSESTPFLKCFNDTYIAYDKLNRAFYIAVNEIKRYGDPEGEPWYFPVQLSSRQATLMLSQTKQDGCFLVYRSTNKQSGALCTLSVSRESGEVFHYHIKEEYDQTVNIQNHEKSFFTLDELVRYFRQNKDKLATRLRRPLSEAELPITPGKHYDMKWEISRNNLIISTELGKGNFGVVWIAKYFKELVAVKTLQRSELKPADQDQFLEEAQVMIGLEHEHILRLIGLSCKEEPYYIITEYVKYGNLRTCLKSGVVKKDDIDGLFDMCIQVTSGMKYLESKKYVLHRDLAARNCLLNENCTVKIADFGMARLVMDDAYHAPKSEKIPIKWAAPEVLKESMYSTKSDVWSAAVVFWEIFSGGERPLSGIAPEEAAIQIVGGHVHPKPRNCPPEMYAVMSLCWKMDASVRPSFSVLYDKLKTKSTMYYATRDLRKEFIRCNLGESKMWQRHRRTHSICDEGSKTGDTLAMDRVHLRVAGADSQITSTLSSLRDTDQEEEFEVEGSDDSKNAATPRLGNLFKSKKNKKTKEKKSKSNFYTGSKD